MKRPEFVVRALLLALFVGLVGFLVTCSGCNGNGVRAGYIAASEAYAFQVDAVLSAHETGLIGDEELRELRPLIEAADAALDDVEQVLPPAGEPESLDDHQRIRAATEVVWSIARRLAVLLEAAEEPGSASAGTEVTR